jgi:Spy/CpxP family protein refolding chaperone
MKRTYATMAAISVFALLATGVWAQGMGGWGSGWGMMDENDMPMMGTGRGCGYGYYGMRGGGTGMMGAGALAALNLTPDQRTKINKIQDELRKQHWALMGKMMDEQVKMRDLYEAEKPDAKKIGAVSDYLQVLRKQMIESRVDAYNRMREVLTKEQREQLNKWPRGAWGMMGSGYGHGYGYGTMMGR